jgi:small redox-active disulfide protein 2
MEIKILGTGCSNCKKLFSEAEKAVHQVGSSATLSKVEDIRDIMAYKIMATPALVIDDVVKSAGRIPASEEIAGWIREASAKA